MFKLVVLFALVAFVAARPGILAPAVYSSAIVGHTPATISSHSSSVVHSAAIAAPIVHAAPIFHATPIISTYAAPAISLHGFHHGGYLH